jgi:hypothetical protein
MMLALFPLLTLLSRLLPLNMIDPLLARGYLSNDLLNLLCNNLRLEVERKDLADLRDLRDLSDITESSSGLFEYLDPDLAF